MGDKSFKDKKEQRFRKMNICSLSKRPCSRLEEIHKTYSLEQNQHIKKPFLECDLRIIVTGKSGVGKSATANTILGEELFPENVLLEVSSLTSELHKETIDGRKITVMETPCLSTLESLEEIFRRRIVDTMVKFARSAHAFVFVFNMASPRFTKEDKLALAAIESLFEGEMKGNRVLVYTHAESCLSSDMDLDQFFEKQTSGENEVANFLKKLNSKIVAVNNKSEIPEEVERNQNVIIGLVDEVVKENEDAMYSNMLLKTTANGNGKQLLSYSDKNCNQIIKDTIEMILVLSPNLSNNQGKLILKVRRQLEEDLERHKKMVSAITLKHIEEEYLKMQTKSYFTTEDKKVKDSGNLKCEIVPVGVNTTLETTAPEETRRKSKEVSANIDQDDFVPTTTKRLEKLSAQGDIEHKSSVRNRAKKRKTVKKTLDVPRVQDEVNAIAVTTGNLDNKEHRKEKFSASIDQDESVPTTTKTLEKPVNTKSADGDIEHDSSVVTKAKTQNSVKKPLDVPHVQDKVRTIAVTIVNFDNKEHRKEEVSANIDQDDSVPTTTKRIKKPEISANIDQEDSVPTATKRLQKPSQRTYGAITREDHFPSTEKRSENWMRINPYVSAENYKLAKSSRNLHRCRNRNEVNTKSTNGDIEHESSVPPRSKKQKPVQKTLDAPNVLSEVRFPASTINLDNMERRKQILRLTPRQNFASIKQLSLDE